MNRPDERQQIARRGAGGVLRAVVVTARILRRTWAAPIAVASISAFASGCGASGGSSPGADGAGGSDSGVGGSLTTDGGGPGESSGDVDTKSPNATDSSGQIALDAMGAGDGVTSSDAVSDAVIGDSAKDVASDGAVGDGDAPAPTGLGAWLSGPPIQSMARQEVGVASIASNVYVIGGYSRLVDSFDTNTGQWRSLAPLPAALDHSNVAAVAGRLYVVGASEAEKVIPGDVNAYLAYDVSLNRWSNIRPMPAGTERGASGVAVIGSKIYVVGGWKTYGTATSYFSSYDTVTDTWEILPDIVPQRDHLVAGAVSGTVFAVGGRNGTIGTPTGRVDAFDPVTKTWSSRAPMITPRGGTAGIVLFNQIYVFGGEGNTTPGSNGVFAQTEAYDPLMNSWRSLAPMIVGKHGIGAASVGGKVYLPGGAIKAGGNAQVASMEVFTP